MRASPDSVPSMEEASIDMSNGLDEIDRLLTDRNSKSPPLSRKLFQTPEKDLPRRKLLDRARSRLSTQKDASPPRLPQSTRPSSIKQPSALSSRSRPLYPKNPPKFTEVEAVRSRSSLGNAPPPEPSCHEGLTLTPKQLSDLFSLFDDARREWPSIFRSAAQTPALTDDGSTCVTGNLSATPYLPQFDETVQNDITADNDVINIESMGAMKLESKIASLRENSVRIMHEMKRIQGELITVSRERQLLKEREIKHEETIAELERELERNRSNNDLKISQNAQRELEHLRVENESFASQIIENEAEMTEIRTILGFMDKENDLMRSTLEALECNVAKGKAGKSCDLVAQIETLATRIAEMERSRELDRQLLEEAAQSRQEMSLLTPPIFGISSDDCKRAEKEVIEDGIEVTINGLVDTKKEVEEGPARSFCCNCFPM